MVIIRGEEEVIDVPFEQEGRSVRACERVFTPAANAMTRMRLSYTHIDTHT